MQHSFPDAEGTLLDGSGRYRVLLAEEDADVPRGTLKTRWSSQSLVVAGTLKPAVKADASMAEGWVQEGWVQEGWAQGDDASLHRETGLLRVHSDGGYTFTLLTSTAGALKVDGVQAETGTLRAQVCGSKGNAVEALRVSVALARGWHQVEITRGAQIENADGADKHARGCCGKDPDWHEAPCRTPRARISPGKQAGPSGPGDAASASLGLDASSCQICSFC